MELTGARARSRFSGPAALAAVGAAVTVIVLLLVTAIASRRPLSGEGQSVAPVGGGRSQINAPPWALALVAGGAAIALLGVLVAIRWERPRRHEREEPPAPKFFQIPLAVRIGVLLIPVILGAVLVVAGIQGSRVRLPPQQTPAPAPRRAASAPTSSYQPPTWILPAVAAVVLGGGGAVLLAVGVRRRLADRVELKPVFAAASLGEVVEASLDDLRTEPDPRRAVIAAYRRMETTLAAAGLPRRAWESPREYSSRAHNYLELSARPLQTLTTLFERARFGLGDVGEPLREQAIAALVALREELAEATNSGEALA